MALELEEVMKWLRWFHKDEVLKVAGGLAVIALAIKQAAAPHTIAYQVADVVLSVAAVLGVTSTTSRANKPKAGG